MGSAVDIELSALQTEGGAGRLVVTDAVDAVESENIEQAPVGIDFAVAILVVRIVKRVNGVAAGVFHDVPDVVGVKVGVGL